MKIKAMQFLSNALRFSSYQPRELKIVTPEGSCLTIHAGARLGDAVKTPTCLLCLQPGLLM